MLFVFVDGVDVRALGRTSAHALPVNQFPNSDLEPVGGDGKRIDYQEVDVEMPGMLCSVMVSGRVAGGAPSSLECASALAADEAHVDGTEDEEIHEVKLHLGRIAESPD